MDLEIAMLSEVSQTEKEKYCMVSLIYRLLKKIDKWKYLQNRNRPRLEEQIYGYRGGMEGGRDS